MKLSLLLIFAAVIINNTAIAIAKENPPTPFTIKSQNPFIQIFGLPTTQPATLLPANGNAIEIASDTANNSIISKVAGTERITLDGESHRLSLTLRHAISHRIEIGLELPLVSHNNGILDNFIEGWHKTLGLTNSERNQSPSNVLNYSYSRNDTTVLSFQQPNDGLGDIRLFAARQLYRGYGSALSLHSSLKLPTGDAKQLYGSGAPDLALSAAYVRMRDANRWQYSAFFNGGLLLLGKSDLMRDIQRSSVLFGSAGIIWGTPSKIDIIVQLDGHTGFYYSALDQLSAKTVQLTVGGAINFTPTTQLDIGVGENLFTDTTPDVLINIALKQHY